MAKTEKTTEAAKQLADKLRFPAEQHNLLLQALTHPAFFEGHRKQNNADNQRLEFLGDAVLDMFIGEYLYYKYPESQEGVLSKMRAFVVCEASLAQAALALGLDKALRLGRGSEAGGDRQRPSVLADAYEAVVGAMFVAMGAEATRKFLFAQFGSQMDSITADDYEDKKSLLQELVQSVATHGVTYKLISTTGPDHAPTFESTVYAGKVLLGTGTGSSKKESEVTAAAEALRCREQWLSKIK